VNNLVELIFTVWHLIDPSIKVIFLDAFVAIKTYWRDKFNRYLADVLYDKDETDLTTLVANGKFLNQELLDKGLAVKV